jgi:hypothetical protein
VRRWSVLFVLAACGNDTAPPAPHRDSAPTMRRVIEPPAGTVRLRPPYAITPTEVGPYKLGQKVTAVLEQLQSGPRILRFEIPSVLRTNVIRAEEGAVLIGGDSTASTVTSVTTFVAVLTSDVARSESGIHVGASRQELGALVDDAERAHDPRLLAPIALRGARVIVEKDRVAAIVIGDAPPHEPLGGEACARPASTDTAMGACLTGSGELISVEDDVIAIRAPDAEKPLASIRVPNLVFAAPLRNAADGRDELVAISRNDEPTARTWTLAAYRFEGKKHVVVIEPTALYQLTSAQTRWIGTDLRDIDLYLELTSVADGIEVGGLLTTATKDKIRDVVVISPRSIERRRVGKPLVGEPADAGVPDANPGSGPDSAKL